MRSTQKLRDRNGIMRTAPEEAFLFAHVDLRIIFKILKHIGPHLLPGAQVRELRILQSHFLSSLGEKLLKCFGDNEQLQPSKEQHQAAHPWLPRLCVVKENLNSRHLLAREGSKNERREEGDAAMVD